MLEQQNLQASFEKINKFYQNTSNEGGSKSRSKTPLCNYQPITAQNMNSLKQQPSKRKLISNLNGGSQLNLF
jgi:hypothetical protein